MAQDQIAIKFELLFLRMWCPANDASASSSVEFALAVYGVRQSHWHAHGQWQNTREMSGALVMALEPFASFLVQLLGW